MSFAIILHIVAGVTAFAGSVLMASSFLPKLSTLSATQKWALALTYVGVMVSTILGFANSMSVAMLVASTVAIVGFTAYEIIKNRKAAKAVANKEVA